MCIGLSISRPEAAIADCSRLIIEDVFPTYISAQSFLQSATFNLNSNQDAHGGFSKDAPQGTLAIGQAREKITGIMGLYLFEEHWQMTTKSIQSVYGFMCTLDIMGYSSE